MHGRGSAENGEQFSAADLTEETGIEVPIAVTGQDRLSYIADMVHQLKVMSAQAKCEALTELLETAHREAIRQVSTRA